MNGPTIDPTHLAERLGSPAAPQPTLVDVRTAAEFETSHIPGSVNVPLDEVKASLDELCSALDEHHDVVLVCRSGARAQQAQEVLLAAGLASSVLSGGIVDWEKSGGAVDRGRQSWELERQVRLAAGSLVVAGIAASTVAPRAKWLSGFVGGGLVFAAVSNTCAMGSVLARMPWNQRGARPTGSALDELTRRR